MVRYSLIDQNYQDYYPNLFKANGQDVGNKTLKTVTFQVTDDCCMACTYCYQHSRTKNSMTFDTAKKFLDKLLADEIDLITTENTLGLLVEFIGGEPFLQAKLIDQICSYLFSQMIKKNHPWLFYTNFTICSNGLLYNTPDVQKVLKKFYPRLFLTISLDGDKNLHDTCRVDLSGKGTYDRVMSAVQQHKKIFGYIPDTKMTFCPENITHVYTALKNLYLTGYEFIYANCSFEEGWDVSHAQIFYKELKKLSDFIIDNNYYSETYCSLFRENEFQPLSPEDNKNWCGGVAGFSMTINYKGDIYPCLRYIESSLGKNAEPIIIGNVDRGYLKSDSDIANNEKVNNITRRSQSTDKCFYCPIAGGCSWCSAYNYEKTGSANKRVTYICQMHQARSLANVYYWNTLYKKLNINKIFSMNIPKEWALQIISEQEYNNLLKLTEGENSYDK